MALTAGAAMNEARDYHATFSREKVPPAVLFRRLIRVEHEIWEHVAAEAPEVLASTVTVPREDIDIALSIRSPVPAEGGMIAPVSARAFLTNGKSKPVAFVTTTTRFDRRAKFPSVTVSAEGIHLTDLRDIGMGKSGWEDVDRLEVRRVPEPRRPVAEASVLSSPDILEAAIVAKLVEFMAVREGVRELMTVGKAEMDSLTLALTAHDAHVSWAVVDA